MNHMTEILSVSVKIWMYTLCKKHSLQSFCGELLLCNFQSDIT